MNRANTEFAALNIAKSEDGVITGIYFEAIIVS